jgi:uncharacterized membrane protein YhaH (DUF805 family)
MIKTLLKNPIQYFKIAVLNKTLDTHSRASRKEYWNFLLGGIYIFIIYFFLVDVLTTIAFELNPPLNPHKKILFICISYLTLIKIPFITAGMRRFQDVNIRGAYYLILYILLFIKLTILLLTHFAIITIHSKLHIALAVGCCLLLLIYVSILIRPSTPGDNKYGPQPKD